MAPSWQPLMRCMQLYCEPYFTAVMRWRDYSDEGLLMNRIQLMETACLIFHNYSLNPSIYHFELICDSDPEEVSLLPEVVSSAGKDFKLGGDKQAFEAARSFVPEAIFMKAGLFFQHNLLKAMAGWNEEKLASCNIATRRTVIECVEKLFRLSEQSGPARFVFRHMTAESDYIQPTTQNFESVPLSNDGLIFKDYLQTSLVSATRLPPAQAASSAAGTSTAVKKSKKQYSNDSHHKRRAGSGDTCSMQDEWKGDEDQARWTTAHKSVGFRVAAHFPAPGLVGTQGSASGNGNKTLLVYNGVVVRYCPPSQLGLDDALYHILWEDNDEQDFDEEDLQRGLWCYQKLEGWTTEHHMVGRRVAGFFEDPTAVEDVDGGRGGNSSSEGADAEDKDEEVEDEDDDAEDEEEGYDGGRVGKGGSSRKRRRGAKAARRPKAAPMLAIFEGKVTGFLPPTQEEPDPLYHIRWDDGDEQDMDSDELEGALSLHKQHFSASANASNASSRSSNSRSKSPLKSKSKSSKSPSQSSANKTKKKAGKKKAGKTDGNQGGSETISSVLRHALIDTSASAASSTSSVSEGNGAMDDSPAPHASKKPRKETQSLQRVEQQVKKQQQEEEEEKKEEEEEIPWTTQHESVGTRVGSYFLVPVNEADAGDTSSGKCKKGGKNGGKKGGKKRGKKPAQTAVMFEGTVTRYAPPSCATEDDALYHVQWDDGDEEDYDRRQLENGYATLIATKPAQLPTAAAPAAAPTPTAPTAPAPTAPAPTVPTPMLPASSTAIATSSHTGASPRVAPAASPASVPLSPPISFPISAPVPAISQADDSAQENTGGTNLEAAESNAEDSAQENTGGTNLEAAESNAEDDWADIDAATIPFLHPEDNLHATDLHQLDVGLSDVSAAYLGTTHDTTRPLDDDAIAEAVAEAKAHGEPDQAEAEAEVVIGVPPPAPSSPAEPLSVPAPSAPANPAHPVPPYGEAQQQP